MKFNKIGGTTILRTDERLDAVTALKLKTVVNELVQENGLRLLIDMEKTRFVDSSGCLALLTLLKLLRTNQGDMKIARPSPQVLNVFKLIQLNKLFEIYDSLESAIDSFA